MIKSKKGHLLNTNAFITATTNSYAANSTIDYFLPVFKSSVVVGNIPAITFTSYNQFILLKLIMPKWSKLSDYNYLSITPYIYQYMNQTVFASVDDTVSLFDYNLNTGKGLNFVFTFSENIANYYSNQNYIVCKLPSDYSLSDFTFTFLFRVGTLLSSPKKKIGKATVKLATMYNFDLGKLYTSNDILSKAKPRLNSYLYYSDISYLNTLLSNYSTIVNSYIAANYTIIPTYLYLSNIAGSTTAITNFYQSIKYSPPLNLQGNNTNENYFNTATLTLSDYIGSSFIIIAVNQNAFGYGLTSNIQIYDTTTLSLIENGSYDTSPELPVIGSVNYPLTNIETPDSSNYSIYPLVNVQTFSVNDIINDNPGITEIVISERICYNPINYNCSNYNSIPKFSVFV